MTVVGHGCLQWNATATYHSRHYYGTNGTLKAGHETRKHMQSYRHADPRRHQQHTAVEARANSNRATVTAFVTVWPWPLTFWPLGQCMLSDYYRVCLPSLVLIAQAVFLLDGGQTDRQTKKTDATERPIPTPAAIQPAWVISCGNGCL